MALLDETVAGGQANHIPDHEQIATKLNGHVLDVVADYGATASGSTNDYNAIATALGDAQAGDTVWLPKGAGGGYKVNSELPAVPSGVLLCGPRLAGEGNYTRLFAGGAMTNLIRLDTGGMVCGLTIDGGANASVALLADGDATGITRCHIRGGTTYTLRNTAATARQRWSELRVQGDNTPTIAVMAVFSTDHIMSSMVVTGSATGGIGLQVNGNTGMFTGFHVNGNSGSGDPLQVLGNQNNFGQVVVDTCGSAAAAPLVVKGSRNTFSACSTMNIFSGLTKPALALRQPSAGANVLGNQFFGFSYIPAAQNQNATGVVSFLSDTGGLPANLAAFKGTMLYFSASSVNPSSGANYVNLVPAAGDAIDIVGYISSGSAGAATLSYRFA